MNKAMRKLISVTLSILMIVGLIVPGTVLTIIAADPTSFPAPTLTKTPQLLKEFAKPDVEISTSFSDSYTLPKSITGSAESGAPVIATITEQAGPNDSISIYGTNLKGASVYAYGLRGGQGVIKKLVQTSNKDGFINAVISLDFDYTMYIVWVQGKDGKVSAPVRVNAPKLTWISDTSAAPGATDIRIYGKFLTTENADGTDATSYVYLTDGTKSYEATVTEATPYRLTVTLPSGLSNGSYKLWVHNGRGGDYGWSNPLDLNINSSSKITWSTSSSLQKTATPSTFSTVISSAPEGSTITLKNGTYVVRQQIKIEKNLRIVGESRDGVIIVCVFAQSGSDCLIYGDPNSNGSTAQAAFYTSTQNCEFSNLTFVDYVKGAEYCTGITAPSKYNIDYAHGMFIRGGDGSATDSGVSGQLKIDSCTFKVRRIYSDASTSSGYVNTALKNQYNETFTKKYGECYSAAGKGSAPLWIAKDRSEITNNYFETPKEVMTRESHGTYIANNTFVGTWVIAGNSGPSAIHDNSSQNLDISNNKIYGMDEKTDPNGHVETGDQTFARTIVLQNTLGSVKSHYVMNNTVSRVGELNYNSGEHILFEDENVTYVGNAGISDNGKTLHLEGMPEKSWIQYDGEYCFSGYTTNDMGELQPATYKRKLKGQVVIISKGTGAGQWRTVTGAAANAYITVDRAWDVPPDENSTIVVAPAFINPVVYGNKIEGPKMYYKNFNSTLGVQAYGTMVGTVIDRNNFSQMQAGLSINPHYNIKSYTLDGETVNAAFNFVMFADMLVMNNTISNTRYGIWNFPSITRQTTDAIDDPDDPEAIVDLQLCSIIRGNNISGQRRLVMDVADTNDQVTVELYYRGGVGIVVGRDFYGKPAKGLSTRYWMNNIVVENNTLSNVKNNNGNGYIDVGLSQKDTILRNNVTGGQVKSTYAEIEVERSYSGFNITHKPVAPIYFTDETLGEDVGGGGPGGTVADGMIQDPNMEPSERIANNDFLEGLKYWSNSDGTNYASSEASASNSVLVIKKAKGNGIKSAPFKIPASDLSAINQDNKIGFIVKRANTATTLKAELFVDGVSTGAAISGTHFSNEKLTFFYFDGVCWNQNSTYQIAITASNALNEIKIDYVDMARYNEKSAVLDLINGKMYSATKGELSEEDAVNTDKTTEFRNNEFVYGSDGLEHWKKASFFGLASVSNGIASINSAKLQSTYFTPALKNGDSIALIYNFNTATDVKVSLLQKVVKTDGTEVNTTLINATAITATGRGLTDFVTYTAGEEETYLSIVVEGTAALDYISVVTMSGSGVSLVYTDIVTGNRYLSDWRDPDGTEEAGFEKLNKAYGSNETYAINDTLMNGDFSEGLKYWSAANNSRTIAGTMIGNAADSAKKVENGVVTIIPSGYSGRGISSAHFKVPNAKKDGKFYVAFDYNHNPGDITGLTAGVDYTKGFHDKFKVEVLAGASHKSVKSTTLTGTNGQWQSAKLEVSITDADNFYTISFEGFNVKTEFMLKNVRLLCQDIGGLKEAPIVGVDGKLEAGQILGDANYDNNVDLLDLVRMKKEIAKKNTNGIFFAAADVEKDGNLDAYDLIEVIAMVMGKK